MVLEVEREHCFLFSTLWSWSFCNWLMLFWKLRRESYIPLALQSKDWKLPKTSHVLRIYPSLEPCFSYYCLSVLKSRKVVSRENTCLNIIPTVQTEAIRPIESAPTTIPSKPDPRNPTYLPITHSNLCIPGHRGAMHHGQSN